MKNHPKILHWAPTYGSKTGTGLATKAWLGALVAAAGSGDSFEVVTTVKEGSAPSTDESPRVFGSESRAERQEYLRTALPGLDVIHFHGGFDPELTTTLRKALAERRRRLASDRPLKVFLTPHGAQSWQVFRRNRLKKWLYWRAVDRQLMQAVDAYVCNTPAEAQDMETRLGGTKCMVIPLALPVEYLESPDKPGVRDSANPGEPQVLCTLGRYDINMKGLDILMNAVRSINESGRRVILRCIGYDGKGGTESLERFANSSGCGGFVECVGPMWGREKNDAVASCDLFCIPSRYESFGFSVFDGLVAGLPVLMGEGVCIGSLLPDELRKSVTVKPTAESWASAIARALDSVGTFKNQAKLIHRSLMLACDPGVIGESLLATYGY